MKTHYFPMKTHNFPSSSSAARSQYRANISYLLGINQRLVDALQSEDIAFDISTSDLGATVVLVNGEQISENLEDTISANCSAQMLKPDRVLMARIDNPIKPAPSNTLLADVIDSEDLIALSQLSNLKSSQTSVEEVLCRDFLLLGSLSLLYTPLLLQSAVVNSLVLIESDLSQLRILLHLVNLEEIVNNLREACIGFHFIYQADLESLCFDLFTYLTERNPLALHGVQIFRSPKLAPSLIELRAWIHSQDGLLEHAKGFLGNDTDEINQTLHAIWNTNQFKNARLLQPDILPDEYPVLLVASGPSLDLQLSWLKKNHHKYTIIAAGSSIGALLREGIHVDAVVLLEMGSVVFRDISDLILEGYRLSEVILFASLTVDPRIASSFKEVIFYHRPLSTVSALFPSEQTAHLPQAGPQAANAALEVVLQLGSRRLALMGCDFGASTLSKPRASGSIGSSERIFDMPVRGNLGRTIYTSAELSVTKQLFENAIKLYGAYVLCVGEGTVSSSDICYETAEIASSALCEFTSDPAVFHASVSTLPYRCNDLLALKNSIDDIQQYHEHVVSEILGILQSYPSWNHDLSLKLGCYVCTASPNKFSHAQLAHQRLTRFLLFFVLQPLHDCPSVPSDWSQRRDEAYDSIRQVRDYIGQFLSFLSLIAKADTLPSWDPQWIKSRITAMEKY